MPYIDNISYNSFLVFSEVQIKELIYLTLFHYALINVKKDISDLEESLSYSHQKLCEE